ncbi:MAG: hypothetical protein U0136_17105 [Bdellovibrionota bacterium]
MRYFSEFSAALIAAMSISLSCAAPAHAASSDPATLLSKQVRSIQKSVQSGFVKNAKSLLKADRKAAQAKPHTTTRSSAGSDSAPTSGVSTHNIFFGLNCPNGGRYFFTGTGVTDLSTGSVTYRGFSTFNNCGTLQTYGFTGTTASVIPATGGYSVDTAGLLSSVTSMCSGVATNVGFDLSIDGTSSGGTVEGSIGAYCAQTQLEVCTFPAGTPVNNQLSSFCTGSL